MAIRKKKPEKVKLTTGMYLDALKRDDETLALIRRHGGPAAEKTLNTPERRACFRVGYDVGPKAALGKFGHPGTALERLWVWRALHPKKATEDDVFYAYLGASMSELWKERARKQRRGGGN